LEIAYSGFSTRSGALDLTIHLMKKMMIVYIFYEDFFMVSMVK
jgi:hypothetical protein